MAYRSSQHDSTKQTPFSMLFGREIRLPLDLRYELPTNRTSEQKASHDEYVENLRKSLHEAHSEARKNLRVAHKRMKENYDRNVRPA